MIDEVAGLDRAADGDHHAGGHGADRPNGLPTAMTFSPIIRSRTQIPMRQRRVELSTLSTARSLVRIGADQPRRDLRCRR